MGNLLCFLLHLWVILPVNVRLSHIAPNLKTFPWCGGPQNPMEAAKTGRVATAVFFSCKDEVQRLNISSAFIQVTMELYNAAGKCTHKFSQAAMFVFPTWRQKYNVNIDSFIGAFQRCAFPKFPKGVIYGLKTLDYFRYFASG
ncbi:uncharacterized protein LOC142574131 isoform X3 [Dermacentor variabilis]|uniref:uncharacterized protein LOC142574131 isoform X3 n=1 Tax=Dermacentor variabilis TaxID=34621 RepID=UPI003F5BF6E0